MTPTPDREPIREGLARAIAREFDHADWDTTFIAGKEVPCWHLYARHADACLTYLIKRQAFHSDAYAVIKKEGLGKETR